MAFEHQLEALEKTGTNSTKSRLLLPKVLSQLTNTWDTKKDDSSSRLVFEKISDHLTLYVKQHFN